MKAKKCGYCGSINSADARRCQRCGINIASAIVSDDYASEDLLTPDETVVPISSINDTDLVKQLRRAANPMSGSVVRPQPRETTALKDQDPFEAHEGADISADEGRPDEGQHHRRPHAPVFTVSNGNHTEATQTSRSSETQATMPIHTAGILITGSRLVGWLLLVGALVAAAFTLKKFGFSAGPDASPAGLFVLENWDPYWAGLAVTITLLGLIGFVLLHLGAAIVENLSVIRAELCKSNALALPAHATPEAAPEPERSDAGPDKMPQRASEPDFSLSAEQFLEAEREAYGTVEPMLVDDDKGDHRKEPTLGA